MPTEVEEWERAAGGGGAAEGGGAGAHPPRPPLSLEGLAWGLPAEERDAAAGSLVERALRAALGDEEVVVTLTRSSEGCPAGTFANGGAAAPLYVKFGSNEAALEGARLSHVTVPREGERGPFEVAVFLRGSSLGQPPLILPGEPWSLDGRMPPDAQLGAGRGSAAELLSVIDSRGGPGDASVRETVRTVLLRDHVSRRPVLNGSCGDIGTREPPPGKRRREQGPGGELDLQKYPRSARSEAAVGSNVPDAEL